MLLLICFERLGHEVLAIRVEPFVCLLWVRPLGVFELGDTTCKVFAITILLEILQQLLSLFGYRLKLCQLFQTINIRTNELNRALL